MSEKTKTVEVNEFSAGNHDGGHFNFRISFRQVIDRLESQGINTKEPFSITDYDPLLGYITVVQ